MKMLDMLVEKSLVSSKKFVHAVRTIHSMARDLTSLAKEVAAIAYHVRRHEAMLRQIGFVHNVMMQQQAQDVTELKLATKKKPTEEKPN